METLDLYKSPDCLQEDCNTTWINTGDLPSITFFRSLTWLDRSFIIVSFVISLISNFLFVFQIVMLYRRRYSATYIKLASALLALYPVYQNIGFVAMMIPRATEFMGVLIGAYTMIAFNDFSNMLTFISGGPRKLLEKMDDEEMRRPKFCSCLPKATWTKKRVLTVRLLIRQGKFVHYLYVVLFATLLLNGNYQQRPMEFDRPLFWFSMVAGISRFVATVSLVNFVQSIIHVLGGHSLGKKFVALQIINIVHLVQDFILVFLSARDIGLKSYGLVRVENRLELYRYFSQSLITIACQLWAIYLFYHSPSTQFIKANSGSTNSATTSMSESVNWEEAGDSKGNRAV